jgi:hypothetical protein
MTAVDAGNGRAAKEMFHDLGLRDAQLMNK